MLTVRHNLIIRNRYRTNSRGIQSKCPVTDAKEVGVENPNEETSITERSRTKSGHIGLQERPFFRHERKGVVGQLHDQSRKQKAANVIEAGGMIDKATKSGAI